MEEKAEKKKKANKKGIVYYDDDSTIADMSIDVRTGKKKKERPPRKQSTAKEKWSTYWHAVKTMIIPMCVVLIILGVLYFICYFLYLTSL